MRYVMIINPAAGKKKAYIKTYLQFVEAFGRLNIPFECFITEQRGHATEFTRELTVTDEPTRIYSFGGDGTLCEVVNGALGHDNIEIGVVPTGSGNDFIKAFGKKGTFLSAEKQIHAPSRYIDIIRTERIVAVNVVSVGLDAEIGKKMTAFKNLPFINGKMAYNLAVIWKLLGKLGKNLEIVIDGAKRVSGNFIFALAANGSWYGGGYHCAPDAVTDDGILEFIAIKTPKLYRIPELLKLYKNGSYIHSQKMDGLLYYFRGNKMEIHSNENLSTNYDGEILTNKHETFEILPKAIRFIVPEGE